ncbi:hypothetical protein [Couchioplanes caeruleus]|uniref:Uncharacterized protein n=1 Tax=Couchioplanes caeruleus TaxID=56438 RepID=A0A3N1GHQ8_9ACTN|nr:hypothetical protein [Couchioplanes caeruleus]ROP29784.1 hypothetical protein EDD30_2599 [Couchioplanes caeruleus]
MTKPAIRGWHILAALALAFAALAYHSTGTGRPLLATAAVAFTISATCAASTHRPGNTR